MLLKSKITHLASSRPYLRETPSNEYLFNSLRNFTRFCCIYFFSIFSILFHFLALLCFVEVFVFCHNLLLKLDLFSFRSGGRLHFDSLRFVGIVIGGLIASSDFWLNWFHLWMNYFWSARCIAKASSVQHTRFETECFHVSRLEIFSLPARGLLACERGNESRPKSGNVARTI